jgi:very-short-patch-repair endonuclease
MGTKVAKPDALLAEIAGRQHGVASIGQLRSLGLNRKAVRRRVDAGHLHRVHRGVYAVGHTDLSVEGRRFAAVLAVGGGPREDGASVLAYWGAAVSHRSAASLWGILPAGDGPSDIIVGGNGGKIQRPGIRVHRSLSLQPPDVTLRNRIPLTNPRRTIHDLRYAISVSAPGAVSGWELRKAARQANVIGLPIGGEDAADRTRSDLERDFLRLCRRRRLPRPEVNVRIGPYLVDFLWRESRFVVETDSYLYHRGKVAFQDDRSIDLGLMRLGYEVLRLSELQIDEEPARVAEVLTARLALAGNATKRGREEGR